MSIVAGGWVYTKTENIEDDIELLHTLGVKGCEIGKQLNGEPYISHCTVETDEIMENLIKHYVSLYVGAFTLYDTETKIHLPREEQKWWKYKQD